MTVTEIAQAVKMNRHSAAKYLDMLVIAGHIDMKTFGSSKVFYPSRRIPMSAILNLSSDFIVVLDEDMYVINVNDRFLEFEHIQKQDVISRSIVNSSFPMAFNPSIIPHIKRALKGVESEIEASFQKNGDIHYFNVRFIPTVFDDTASGVTMIFKDITARKEAEHALKESEERFRVIFENVEVGIAYLSNKALFIRQNRRFSEILGYSQEDLQKKSYLDITYPEDRALSKDNVDLLTSGKVNFFSMEKRYFKADGSIVWGHVTCSPIRNPDGSLNFFVVVIEDITARKEAEEALRRARDELESRVQERTLALKKANDALIVENERSQRMEAQSLQAFNLMHDVLEKAPFGVYIVNDRGTVDYVNPAMLKISGVDERAFKSLKLFELPTYTAIGLDKLIKSALDGKHFYLGPVEYTSHVGKKASVRNFIGIPMMEADMKKALVFVEDFSKYKLLEEALLNKR
jgi:PAS domain S-box-containing protein